MLPRERLTLQRRVQQQMRMQGLSISKDGLERLLDFIELNGLEIQAAVDLLISGLDQLNSDAQIISASVVSDVFNKQGRANQFSQATGSAAASSQAELDATPPAPLEAEIRVLDAFEMPRVEYDTMRKQYYRSKSQPSIAGEASSKAAMYRNRMQQLLARTRRSKQFSKQGLPGLLGRSADEDRTELTTVQGLVGQSGKQRWVLGLISQLEDGKFFLEDLTSSIPLDLSSVKPSLGLFTENSVVVVSGALQTSGQFKADTISFPPLEEREESMALADGFDFLGSSFMDSNTYASLKAREQEPTVASQMFIFISDIWLDSPQAMSKLGQVLSAYDGLPVVPSVFVLIGNFFSRPFSLATSDLLSIRAAFKALAVLISSNQNLRNSSTFVFVPGAGDPGPCPALPRPGIPASFAEDLVELLPNCVLASNPCRLKFLSQEIVVFREELSWQMQRACVIPPALDLDSDPFHHLVANLAHQAHLCPLPMMRQTVLWEFDHSLALFPLPNLVVLADNIEENQHVSGGVSFAKLGPFSLDGTFLAYRPGSRTVEPCKL